MMEFFERPEVIELANKHCVQTWQIAEEVIKCFGSWQYQKNVTADMLEFIDEELAIQQGDRSVRN